MFECDGIYICAHVHAYMCVCVCVFVCLFVCHCLATGEAFRLIAGYWMGGGNHEVPRG